MKYLTILGRPIQFLDYIFFRNFIFVQVTGGRISKSRLGRRLGFDLKQCLIDTIGHFSNNETRIMIYNFNLRGLILRKLKKK